LIRVPGEVREELIEFLKAHTGIHFLGAHDFTYYRDARRGDLSVTNGWCARSSPCRCGRTWTTRCRIGWPGAIRELFAT
jgi:hypothetical protein